jgi:hypothetical protein
MIGRNSKILKPAVGASLLLFSVSATPSFAQDDPIRCRELAREFCASIGVPGNQQCISNYIMHCEQGTGRSARPDLNAKLD